MDDTHVIPLDECEEVLLAFYPNNYAHYGVKTLIIPVQEILDGAYDNNSNYALVRIKSPAYNDFTSDGYITDFSFNISTSGSVSLIGIISNNPYYAPRMGVYYR